MTGIGSVLNIAKDSLLTQQYAMNVVSNNVANVNTDGYTRQVPVIEAQDPESYGGFMFGQGVKLEDVTRDSNDFINKQLQTSNSQLANMTEKDTYMNVLETIFNQDSNQGISNQLSEFWNSWSDLSNNPSGAAERSSLAQYGTLLSQGFNDASNNLSQVSQEINNSIKAGITTVNQLLSQVAGLNKQIVAAKASGNPNDLLDERDSLVNQIGEYLNINTNESDDGNLTISTNKGRVLVSKGDSYPLSFDGTDIKWGSTDSSGGTVITDDVTGGKLGAWLDLRDETIPTYSTNLDELAKSITWEVNQAHSQGVGLEGFTSLTGSYASTDISKAMGTQDSGLDFSDKIKDGSFKLWLYDKSGNVVGEKTIAIDADKTSMSDLATAIDSANIGGQDALNATTKNGHLYIETDANHSGYTFGFSDDSSNVLAALGVNTFFTGANAGDMSVNSQILDNNNYIAAAKISNNVGQAVGASTNTSTGIVTTSGPYTGSADATYEIQIVDPAAGTFEWKKDDGSWSAPTSMTGSPAVGTEGVTVTFNGNIATDYTAGDTFTIDATQSSATYGSFASGDNTNALAISNIQYDDVPVKQWTFSRTDGSSSQDVTDSTINDYFNQMVGQVGIESQSVQRQKSYDETLQQQISQTKDSISGVSLDEEMTNLIKYQQAYTAAAKLITTAQQMMDDIFSAVGQG